MPSRKSPTRGAGTWSNSCGTRQVTMATATAPTSALTQRMANELLRTSAADVLPLSASYSPTNFPIAVCNPRSSRLTYALHCRISTHALYAAGAKRRTRKGGSTRATKHREDDPRQVGGCALQDPSAHATWEGEGIETILTTPWIGVGLFSFHASPASRQRPSNWRSRAISGPDLSFFSRRSNSHFLREGVRFARDRVDLRIDNRGSSQPALANSTASRPLIGDRFWA